MQPSKRSGLGVRGVVVLTRPVDRAVAEALVSIFPEIVIAPGFDDAAREVLATKPNLRVLVGPPRRTTAHRSATTSTPTRSGQSGPPEAPCSSPHRTRSPTTLRSGSACDPTRAIGRGDPISTCVAARPRRHLERDRPRPRATADRDRLGPDEPGGCRAAGSRRPAPCSATPHGRCCPASDAFYPFPDGSRSVSRPA